MNKANGKKGKKIIHVVQHLAPGGIETLTLELLRFSHPDDRTLIISLEGTKKEALKTWPRLKEYEKKIVFLKKKPGIQFGTILTLMNIFKGVKPDVVHTHHIGPLIYAGCAAKLSGVRARIHTEHDAWHLQNTKRKNTQNLILKLTKPTIIADAMHVKEQLDNLLSYNKTVVIKNGIDCHKFQPNSQKRACQSMRLPEDKLIIGCAGRLVKVKGHEFAIKSLSLLPKNTLLAIAGEGPERKQLTRLAHKLNVSDRVIFLGQVDNMPTFYQCLNVFCMPSLHEGLPLSLLEAQACNIPVIATNVGAAEEAICPHTGQLIRAGNIPEMVASLLHTLLHPHTAMPREFIVRNYEISDMAKAYNDLALGELA